VILEQVPLQVGLRRILGSLNNAFVYLPDHTIKIVIMEKSPSPSAGSISMDRQQDPSRSPPALNRQQGRSRRPPALSSSSPPIQAPEPPAAPEQSNQTIGGNGEEANQQEDQPASN
jgi:hypothetical protein